MMAKTSSGQGSTLGGEGGTHSRSESGTPAVAPPADNTAQVLFAQGSSGLSPSELATTLLEALKILFSETESYVQYFEQRFRLEEEHIRALKTMLERQRELDLRVNNRLATTPGLLPDTHTFSSLRNAWGDLRVSEMWMVDVRTKALQASKQTTLQPIVQLRDSQERIRRRVKDDVRASIDEYEEMYNITLPRIRRTYEKRCDELVFYRNQQRAIEEQRSLLSGPASPQQEASRLPMDTATVGADTIRATGDPIAVSPMDRAAAMQPSASGPGAMSPPSSNGESQNNSYFALGATSPHQPVTSPGAGRNYFSHAIWRKEGWDVAPRKLNALFNRMLDGPSGDSSATTSSAPLPEAAVGAEASAPHASTGSLKSHQVLAVKQARAKREADEAERAYRRGIFHLETLRIRRNKTLAAAATSILEWRRELVLTMKIACTQQAHDSAQITSTLQSVQQQDEQTAARMVEHLEQEQQHCEEWLPSVRSLVQEEPVQYVNYWHGPYQDLIFGTGLVDYAFSHGDGAGSRPPLIVTKCIQFMEQPRCINTPGIYRVSAKYSRLPELTSAIERNERSFQFDAEREEPSVVASILKLYLRQLPEPVMNMPWDERIRYTRDREEHIRNGFVALKGRIRRLPSIHQATLRALLLHLSNVASHAEVNKMTVANLAVVFSPVVLSEADHDMTSIAAATEEDRTMEDLITYFHDIFPAPLGRNSPLPPVPGEQRDDGPHTRHLRGTHMRNASAGSEPITHLPAGQVADYMAAVDMLGDGSEPHAVVPERSRSDWSLHDRPPARAGERSTERGADRETPPTPPKPPTPPQRG